MPESNTKPAVAPPSKPLPRVTWWLRETIAVVVWGFAVIKLFVYDLDRYLVDAYAPGLRPVLDFRLFILLGLITSLWLILGNSRFRAFVAYVLLYPLVILLWRIPKLAFSNWAVAIAFFPALHSLVTTFKASFIWTTLALLSCLAVFTATGRLLIVPAMATLGIYLARHYIRRFRMAFRPSSTFADVAQLVRRLWANVEPTAIEKPLRETAALDRNSQEYRNRYQANLDTLYLFVNVLQLLSEKLRDVAASRKLDLYLIGALGYTVLLTVGIFGIEYWALEKIVPGSFTGTDSVGFWSLLGYSFASLMTADIAGLRPSSTAATLMSYGELVASLLILVILVFVILTIGRERYRDDMDHVIRELGVSADRLGVLIDREFSMSVGELEVAVLTVNEGLVNGVRLIRGLEKLEPPAAPAKAGEPAEPEA